MMIFSFFLLDDSEARRRKRRSSEPKAPPAKYELTDGESKVEIKKNQILLSYRGQTSVTELPFKEPEYKLASFRYSDRIPQKRHFIQLFYWAKPRLNTFSDSSQTPLNLLWVLFEAKAGKLVHVTTEEEVYSAFGSPLDGPPAHIENAVRLQVNAQQQVEWVKEPREPELITE